MILVSGDGAYDHCVLLSFVSCEEQYVSLVLSPEYDSTALLTHIFQHPCGGFGYGAVKSNKGISV
jgi:hypothetical protein